METIISSIITGAIAIAVCIINNKAEANKSRALIEYQISELTKKVEKHNNLIERTYKLEEQAGLATAEFKRVNHRLEKLEEGDGE